MIFDIYIVPPLLWMYVRYIGHTSDKRSRINDFIKVDEMVIKSNREISNLHSKPIEE